MEWWKVFIAPLLVAAITTIGGFYIGRATAPDVASVEAELKWIDIQNPLAGSAVPIPDLDKLAQSAFKISGLNNLVNKLRFSQAIRIYVLKLSNNTNVRSTKPVEVTADGDSVAMSNDANPPQTELTNKVLIKQLDPGGKATVYIASPGGFGYYLGDPIHVLYDDRKVDIRSQTVPSESDSVVRFILGYPNLAALLLMIASGFGLVVVVSIPFAILTSVSQEFRAKNTSKKEALKLKAFVEYLQQKHPEKFSST